MKVQSYNIISRWQRRCTSINLVSTRNFTVLPEQPLNKFSKTITSPPSQGASQAMLYATGLTPSQMSLAQVLDSYIFLHY